MGIHNQHIFGAYWLATALLVLHLRDVFPQNFRLHGLWVPKIHGFVQQLVDDNKIVSDRLLLQLPKVVLEHVNLLAIEMTRHSGHAATESNGHALQQVPAHHLSVVHRALCICIWFYPIAIIDFLCFSLAGRLLQPAAIVPFIQVRVALQRARNPERQDILQRKRFARAPLSAEHDSVHIYTRSQNIYITRSWGFSSSKKTVAVAVLPTVCLEHLQSREEALCRQIN